jgi:ELWxxDGT repeat protein
MELWKSDGTSAGTVLVHDIRPGPASSDLRDLVAAGGIVFFSADDGVSGRELWKSDGTAAGTVLVADLAPGIQGSGVSRMGAAGAGTRVVFSAFHPLLGYELWRSDGTATGTAVIADSAPGAPSSYPGSSLDRILRAGATVFFSANDGTTGVEPHAVPLSVAGGSIADPFGHGCPGTGGRVPALAASGVPATGGSFTARVSNARPNAPVLFGIGPDGPRVPLAGGCVSYLASRVFFVFGASDAGGVAAFPLAIPNDASLRGAELRTQGLVVDPGGAFASAIAFSNGLHVLIGE